MDDAEITKKFVDNDVIELLKSGELRPDSFANISDGNDFGAINGRKMRINDVLGRDIIITGFQSMPSRKKPDAQCVTIQFLLNGELRIVWTGSVVLKRLLEKYATRMPYRAKIQKCNDAFVLE